MKTFTQAQFEAAAYRLGELIQEARATRDRNLIRRLRRLWQFNAFGRGSRRGEKWSSILKKVDTEGSAWYVWWCDGVREFLQRGHRWN